MLPVVMNLNDKMVNDRQMVTKTIHTSQQTHNQKLTMRFCLKTPKFVCMCKASMTFSVTYIKKKQVTSGIIFIYLQYI